MSARGSLGAVSDWRIYRPAIWLAMLGIALVLVGVFYVGVVIVGAAIGVALRVVIGRRRVRRR